MSICFVNFGDCVVALDEIQGIGEARKDGYQAAIFTKLVTYETKMTVAEAWARLREGLRVLGPVNA